MKIQEEKNKVIKLVSKASGSSLLTPLGFLESLLSSHIHLPVFPLLLSTY